MTQIQDEYYMGLALALAAKGRFTTPPNPNVGCVIVSDNHIVGEGYHYKAGEPHAEIHALRMAGDLAQGATAYVTLEPCSHYGKTPPCADALIRAGVKRVVIAMQDPNPQVAGSGIARLNSAGIETHSGLMAQQAEVLNRGFLKRMRCGMPYVQLKLAASLDGKIAMASGESKWITSPLARQDVQTFRAQSSAILSSSATVLADDPALNVRWHDLPDAIKQDYPKQLVRQPLRVIIDSQNRITPEHQVIRDMGKTLLVHRQISHQSWPGNIEQLLQAEHTGYIDLHALMASLAEKQMNTIWVECGAHLAGALLQAKIVDELIVYIAPKLLGDQATGLCRLPGIEHLSDALHYVITDVTQIGADVRLRLMPELS